jgi:hypothetical protein
MFVEKHVGFLGLNPAKKILHANRNSHLNDTAMRPATAAMFCVEFRDGVEFGHAEASPLPSRCSINLLLGTASRLVIKFCVTPSVKRQREERGSELGSSAYERTDVRFLMC